MGILKETGSVERQQFFNGQRLLDSDLEALEAFNREMRWLHNQSLHMPGLGSGLAATGKKGDREVTVGPGYAIDDMGREIVLIEDRKLQVPPVAGEGGKSAFFDLAVSYKPDDELEQVETRTGLCDTQGTVRLAEEPVFHWVRLTRNDADQYTVEDSKVAADIKLGRKLVVARVEVRDCQLNKDISLAQRRSARPSCQTHIACGVLSPIEWKIDPDFIPNSAALRRVILTILRAFLSEGDVDSAIVAQFLLNQALAIFLSGPSGSLESGSFILPVELTTKVDTRQGAFQTTPCYSARLEGSRINHIMYSSSSLSVDDLPEIHLTVTDG